MSSWKKLIFVMLLTFILYPKTATSDTDVVGVNENLFNAAGPENTVLNDRPVSKLPKEKNQLIKDGIFYFNNERFWESHEALEGAWKQCTGSEKELIQGLILIAAAFVHYQKDENKICLSVLGRAFKKLDNKSGKYHGVDVDSTKLKVIEMIDKKEITTFEI